MSDMTPEQAAQGLAHWSDVVSTEAAYYATAGATEQKRAEALDRANRAREAWNSWARDNATAMERELARARDLLARLAAHLREAVGDPTAEDFGGLDTVTAWIRLDLVREVLAAAKGGAGDR